jgi:hypothetical protein
MNRGKGSHPFRDRRKQAAVDGIGATGPNLINAS